MALTVEIERLISSLPQIGFYKPMVECVTNSIEAGANNIEVELYSAPREGSAIEDDRFITKIIVTDDGEGFTDQNVKSFKEYRTKRKLGLGCKGVGRLTWLKVFAKAEIESVFPVNGTLRKRCFVFDERFDFASAPDDSDMPKGAGCPRTSVILTDVRHPDEKAVPEDVAKARETVLTELLPKLLLVERDITITFKVNHVAMPAHTIQTAELPSLLKKEFPVTVDSQRKTFVLRYWLPDEGTCESLPARTYAFYCANKRAVEPFDEKGLTVSLGGSEKQYGIFLLESTLFDETVDDARNRIAVDGPHLFNRITWDHINQALRPILEEVVYTKWPHLQQEAEEDKAKLTEEHPHLAVYIRSFHAVGRVVRREALENADKQYENTKKEVRKKYETLLVKHKLDDADIQDFHKLAECTTELGKQELAEYIWYRKVVIDVLHRLLARQEPHESVIHSLIMPARTKDTEQVEDNNLWLLDDKFSLYQYAASEREVDLIYRDVCGDDTSESEYADGNNRPDLFIFFSDAKSSEDDLDAVIIELKKFSADQYERGKGLDQLPAYARAFRRRNPQFKRFWLYLVVHEIDESFRELLEDSRGYKPFFSHDGQIYLHYIPSTNSYITVLPAQVLAANAKARNHRFLDIVRAGKS